MIDWRKTKHNYAVLLRKLVWEEAYSIRREKTVNKKTNQDRGEIFTESYQKINDVIISISGTESVCQKLLPQNFGGYATVILPEQ